MSSIFLPLLNDLRAIKTYCRASNINMTNLGYVGYSMGEGVGFMQFTNNTDFKAVAISSYPIQNLSIQLGQRIYLFWAGKMMRLLIVIIYIM